MLVRSTAVVKPVVSTAYKITFKSSGFEAMVGNVFDFPGSDCVVRFACILGGQVGLR